ncbi:hypothetical protein ACJX0J_029864, partial [Zea mays]
RDGPGLYFRNGMKYLKSRKLKSISASAIVLSRYKMNTAEGVQMETHNIYNMNCTLHSTYLLNRRKEISTTFVFQKKRANL